MSLFYLKKTAKKGLSAPEQICPITDNKSVLVNVKYVDFQMIR